MARRVSPGRLAAGPPAPAADRRPRPPGRARRACAGRRAARARVRRQRGLALVRRRAGRLPDGHAAGGVRGRLPLRRVGRAAAHPHAAGAGLAGVLGQRAPPAQHRPPARRAVAPPGGPGLHHAPLGQPLVRPPVPVLGLRPGRAGDLPAHLRLAALRVGGPGRRPLPGLRGRHRHRRVREPQRLRVVHDVPRPRPGRGARAGRRGHLPGAPAARPGGHGGRAQQRLPGARRALRRVGHRADAHRLEPVARRPLLHVHHDRARRHGHPRAALHPLREAVPHLPAAEHGRAWPTPGPAGPTSPRRCAASAASPTPRPPRCTTCRRCCPRWASTTASAQAAGGGNYQEMCPRCRRRLLALAQSVRVGGFR